MHTCACRLMHQHHGLRPCVCPALYAGHCDIVVRYGQQRVGDGGRLSCGGSVCTLHIVHVVPRCIE